MRERFLIGLVSISLLLISALPLFAADGWEANLEVKVLNADNRLSFGQRSDATDGIDGKYEVPIMQGGDLTACFLIDGSEFWRDIKAMGKQKTWHLRIESPSLNEQVLIKWTRDKLPAGSDVTLVDETTGVATSMRNADGYAYQNKGARDLKIVVTQ